jgi:hypothetical protein
VVTTDLAWPQAQRCVAREDGGLPLLAQNASELEQLLAVEAITNPAVRFAQGKLTGIPRERRYDGPNTFVVMRPFLLIGASRFSDGGSLGVPYAAETVETGLAESTHHQAARLRQARAPRGLSGRMQAYTLSTAGTLVDVRGPSDVDPAIYDPENYTAAQRFGRSLRDGGYRGVVYDSFRHPGGACAGLFWPDAVLDVSASDAWLYYYDGDRISEFARVV